MSLNATIHQVTTGAHDQPQIHFSLHDGEDTGMVSFLDTIGLAHATFLVENDAIRGDDAYVQMLRAFAEAEDANSLVGREFVSGGGDE